MNFRPLDKYLSSTSPTTSAPQIDTKDIKFKAKLSNLNLKIKKQKEYKYCLLDDLILLVKSNASKHKQFIKECELGVATKVLDKLYVSKKELLLSRE